MMPRMRACGLSDDGSRELKKVGDSNPVVGLCRETASEDNVDTLLSLIDDTPVMKLRFGNARLRRKIERSGLGILELLKLSDSKIDEIFKSDVDAADEVIAAKRVFEDDPGRFAKAVLGKVDEDIVAFALLRAKLDETSAKSDSSNELSPAELILASLEEKIDSELALELIKSFGLKTKQLAKWLQAEEEAVKVLISSGIGKGCWRGFSLSEEERLMLTRMVEVDRMFSYTKEGVGLHILNDKTSRVFVLVVKDGMIRAFADEDLPDEIRELLSRQLMNKCTALELSQLDKVGEFVHILKRKHLKVTKPSILKKLAYERKMGPDEYVAFMYGVPTLAGNVRATDESICQFLEERSGRGAVSVPPGSEGGWVRNFARTHGLSEEQLLELYGYAGSASPCEHCNVLAEEPDMGEGPSVIEDGADLDDVVMNAYRCNALIGNVLLGEDLRSQLNREASAAVSVAMEKSTSRLSLLEKMKITLAAALCVNDSDGSDELDFWNQIAMKLGFLGRSGSQSGDKLRRVFCECVEDALRQNGKMFVSSAVQKHYKTSLLVHGMGPRENWLLLCELLKDFYAENLGYKWMPNDPAIEKMALVFRDRFSFHGEYLDESSIFTKAYRLQEAIRTIICARPRFASVMFSRMIKRIDGHFSGQVERAVSYEEHLVDLWWENRRSLSGRPLVEKNTNGAVLTKSSCRPSLRLRNERDIEISFPGLRLEEPSFALLEVVYLTEGEIRYRRPLQYYGNELLKTAMPFVEELGNLSRRGASVGLSTHMQILSDGVVEYDSRESLSREVAFFSQGAEVKGSAVRAGDYSIAMPSKAKFKAENIDLQLVKEEVGYSLYFAELHEGFWFELEGRLVCFDRRRPGGQVEISYEKRWPEASLNLRGRPHSLVAPGDAMVFRLPDGAEVDELRFMASECQMDVRGYEGAADSTSAVVARIPQHLRGPHDIVVEERVSGRMVARESVLVVEKASLSFNKTFYLSEEDYSGAFLSYTIGREAGEVALQEMQRNVAIPFDEGLLEVDVPAVVLKDPTGEVDWCGLIEWVGNIREEQSLALSQPPSCQVCLLVGDRLVERGRTGLFPIGSRIIEEMRATGAPYLDITLRIDEGGAASSSRKVARILATESFLTAPAFALEGRDLVWNCGGGFVGGQDCDLSLRLEGIKGDSRIEYPLSLSTNLVKEGAEIPDGEYAFEVVKRSSNVFEIEETIIASGSVLLGDKNLHRFQGKKIVIEATTFEEDDTLRRVELLPAYIEDIEYEGLREFEGAMRPEYSGVMYYLANGKKKYYSFEERTSQKGDEFLALNPVRVVYLSDASLCVWAGTEDVPNCSKPAGSSATYRITAVNRYASKFGYGEMSIITPDLFVYRKEDI